MAQKSAVQIGDAQTPPDVIHFCWTNCFSLSFRNGRYTRTDSSDETWTVERFTPTSVILHRHGVPAAWNGFSDDVTYQGQVSKDRLINVTLNGKAVPDINMAWGAALDTLPGSNAERDQRNAAQMKKQAIDVNPAPPADIEPTVAVEMRAAEAPPPLLNDEQPPSAGEGYLWTPGYWAWDGGYYWVRGAWLLPPRVGILWTPGYWAYAGAVYTFHAGYWGPHMGFYGGINYGFGYPGAGLNKVSYNGGPGGITAAATAQERAAAAEPHIPPTALQSQLSQQAAGNLPLIARANEGHPAVAVTHRAAASNLPRAPSTVVRPARAGAAPRTIDHANRVQSPPTNAANPQRRDGQSQRTDGQSQRTDGQSQRTAGQPAGPKPSGAPSKSQLLPKR